MRNVQELTSRALALAGTPYQQSGTRVDILAPRPRIVQAALASGHMQIIRVGD